MSDTILRKAHMSAIREVGDLRKRITRLEAGIGVAECTNQYLAARLQLHGAPKYKMDQAILTLAQSAINCDNNEVMEQAVLALRELMGLARKFTNEAITELAGCRDEDLIHKVLTRVDEKLVAHREELLDRLGITPDQIEQMVDEISRELGLEEEDS